VVEHRHRDAAASSSASISRPGTASGSRQTVARAACSTARRACVASRRAASRTPAAAWHPRWPPVWSSL
jgi:hypothetical protein